LSGLCGKKESKRIFLITLKRRKKKKNTEEEKRRERERKETIFVYLDFAGKKGKKKGHEWSYAK